MFGLKDELMSVGDKSLMAGSSVSTFVLVNPTITLWLGDINFYTTDNWKGVRNPPVVMYCGLMSQLTQLTV